MRFRNPRYLYKYYCFDEKKHFEDILFRDILYFSSPKNFNDPFDRGLNIIFKGKCKRFIKNYLVKNLLPSSIDNFDKAKEEKANDFIDKNYSAFDPNIKANESLLQENQLKFVLSSGVCCFSQMNQNILMWSLYANKHTGFCVEFNFDELVKSILNYNEKNKAIIYARDVIYKKGYPLVTGYDKDQVDSLFTKASFWKFEKEWRFFYSDGNDKRIPLPENVITSIYMGIEIDPSNEEIIKKVISEKKYRLNLFKAKKVQNKFAISFEKLVNSFPTNKQFNN